MRGLLEHRFLHADPNLANFAFLEDGRLVVYDFGCVKEVSADFARNYAEILVASAEGRSEVVPGILKRMGLHMNDGAPIPDEAIDGYVEMLEEPLRESPPYSFGDNAEIFERLLDLGLSNMRYSKDMVFPRDAVFINRTLGGHFGNLSRLRATGPWREIVLRFAQDPRIPVRRPAGEP
jgi:predicted unusual protein kinase regulating ubiquinone biosynthesis (AarF/ABC1/UbiB family)